MHQELASKRVAAGETGSIVLAQLARAHRDAVLEHLRSLPAEDRRLRFGHAITDAALARYVRRIRFSRDAAFGAFDDRGTLIAFGHLAFADDGVEFALSVDASVRGHGLGRALLERAAEHARNRGYRMMTMLYLPENVALAALARRAGMQIVCDAAECRAYVGLDAPTAQSVLQEAWHEAMAAIDVGLRRAATHRTTSA